MEIEELDEERSISADVTDDRNVASLFDVNLSYQGKSTLIQVSSSTSGSDLHQQALEVLFGIITHSIDDDTVEDADGSGVEMLKLLFKGKRIQPQRDAFPFKDFNNNNNKTKTKTKPLKVMVMATNKSAIEELSKKRSDPLIRGFDQEKEMIDRRKALRNTADSVTSSGTKYWGGGGGGNNNAGSDFVQDRNYKFCKLKACTEHSFGYDGERSTSTNTAPHEFKAMELLEILVTDPGVVAIMKERELVVGTLGEMDPIDDRIMQKMQNEHGGDRSRLLGYNTNRGLRIDIKLRSDDLTAFRPYPELVSTLIHELSHNWVGDHNLLFWTNYAQMRTEYLYTHNRLRKKRKSKKSVHELAGLDVSQLENVFDTIMNELSYDMRQHGLHPNMIVDPIQRRIRQLDEESVELEKKYNEQQRGRGYRLGCGGAGSSGATGSNGGDNNNLHNAAAAVGSSSSSLLSTRELALAAAERRAREQQQQKEKNKEK